MILTFINFRTKGNYDKIFKKGRKRGEEADCAQIKML